MELTTELLFFKQLSSRIEFRYGHPYWIFECGSGSNRKGDLAGSLDNDKYRFITTSICGESKKIAAHRLRFFMAYDYIPDIVDHINGDRDDNNIENLRECTARQNNLNRRPLKNSSSKYKGVTWRKSKSKWEAGIKVNGKSIYLGMFTDELEAAKSYNNSAIQYFGEFAYLNEIPEPKREFKDGAHYPFMYDKHKSTGQYEAKLNRISGLRIEDPNINWIGEELVINWPADGSKISHWDFSGYKRPPTHEEILAEDRGRSGLKVNYKI